MGELSPRDALLRMTNGYQVSQAIHVAATLGIAELLEEGSKSVDELAEATGTYAPTLYRLLRALASVGVFTEQSDGRFGLTPPAEYLRMDAPGSLRAWARLIGQPSFGASGRGGRTELRLLESRRPGRRGRRRGWPTRDDPGGESGSTRRPVRPTPRSGRRRSPAQTGGLGRPLRGRRWQLLRDGAQGGGRLPAQEHHPRLG